MSVNLLLPEYLMEEKEKLKVYLGKAVDTIVLKNQHKRDPYFVIYHEKMDGEGISKQKIRIESSLPGFITNSIVFWVDNRRGICEWLWTVPPKEGKKKLKVEFNTSGVAYLKAKGAMPS